MASNTDEFEYFGSEMYEDEIQIIHEMETLSVEDCYSASKTDFKSRVNLFQRPACLIYTDENGLLEIDQNVLAKLSNINMKINVVGVCGMYRSGKSYLMNWIAGKRKGFKLGDTIQSETKGIWIWCKKHPNHRDQVLVLIDTEGLDDPEKGDPEHDNKLFCLTLLLSSTLIINLKEVFNYSALDKLAFIVSLSDSIKILNGEDGERFNDKNIPVASPHLIMCIRDFFLKNEKEGKTQTPDKYLEDNLKPVTGTTKSRDVRFNKIKQAITQYFPKRKCFTLAQPAMGEDLQKIESLDEKALHQKFVDDMTNLLDYVYRRKPKYICNASKKPLDGADLANLITSYVKSLRQDTPIRCEDAYAQASEQRNERVLQTVMKVFKKEMEKGRSLKSKESLQNMFLTFHDQSLTKYREGSFLYCQDNFEERITAQMEEQVNEIKAELSQKCQEVGSKILAGMYDRMLNAKSKFYQSPDNGYTCYEEDMESLKSDFFKKMKDYDKDDLYMCWDNFVKTKKDDKMALYLLATGQENQIKYRQVHDELNNKLDSRLASFIFDEKEKRNKYLEQELEKLRADYKELSESMKKKQSLCSIM